MTENTAKWGLLQKTGFRFLFLYIGITIAPWTWLDDIPGVSYLTQFYRQGFDALVVFCNKQFFHFANTTIVNNGSGDTSRNWEEMLTILLMSLLGTVIWSIIDRKRNEYEKAAYWLRLTTRYFLILQCFVYGIEKLFVLQMPFPNQSQLATPLGDFLPMRFSWMFIGYSAPYQIFSGVMEIVAGILLLNRKTITLGILVAAGVFANVMMLNLCYDIPVKLFSIHLFLFCMYLLLTDGKRLFAFFIQNKAVSAYNGYTVSFPKKWMRITRIVAKTLFIILYGGIVFYNYWEVSDNVQNQKSDAVFKTGVYDVLVYAKNTDTLPPLITDTLRWKDIIFEKNGLGSVVSADTSFRQRYGRGYFNFVRDSSTQTIGFKKLASDTVFQYRFKYKLTDSGTIQMAGSHKTDSLYVVLKKSRRHFQLAERQFHWISEANR